MKRIFKIVLVALIAQLCVSQYSIADQVYWSLLTSGVSSIQRADLDGSNVEDVASPGARPYHILIDPVCRKLYWHQFTGTGVYRASLDGSADEELLGIQTFTIGLNHATRRLYAQASPASQAITEYNLDGLNPRPVSTVTPDIMVVDSLNNHLYHSDTRSDELRRTDLSAGTTEIVVSKALGDPVVDLHSIAVDAVGGKLYWAGADSQGSSAAIIARANLDGSGVEVIRSFGGNFFDPGPSGIDLDVAAGKLYWAESERKGGGGSIGRIRRSNLDGSDEETILDGIEPGPSAIALLLDSAELASVASARFSPQRGGDTGSVTIYTTVPFSPGAAVSLVRSGEPDIAGDPYAHTLNGECPLLAATFDLFGRTHGAWNLKITHPDGSTQVLAEPFTIEGGDEIDLYTQIVGPAAVRGEREGRYTVIVGNRSNKDAYGAILFIALPADRESELFPPPVFPSGSFIDFNDVDEFVIHEGEKIYSRFINTLPALQELNFDFRFIAPHVFGTNIRTWVSRPLYPNGLPSAPASALTATAERFAGASPRAVGGNGSDQETIDGLMDQFGSFRGRSREALDALAQDTAGSTAGDHAMTGLIAAAIGAAAIAAGLAAVPATAAFAVQLAAAGMSIWAISTFAGHFQSAEFSSISVGAIDPNEKYGPGGVGPEGWLNPDGSITYRIAFENLDTATAAAQEIRITDQLDTTVIAPTSLEFGQITFGDHTLIPLPGSHTYSGAVDLQPTLDLIVWVEADVDTITGEVEWRLLGRDPVTGQLPADPLLGFLPPNIVPAEGEGYVTFRVRPLAALPTGTQIRNSASITFDLNAPIDTPEVLNTLDVTPPTSQVASLPITQTKRDFTVTWGGTDVGAGLHSYDVFVSVDNGEFFKLVDDSDADSVEFPGEDGHQYAFYSVARDLAGNIEPKAPIGETSTTVAVVPLEQSKAQQQCITRMNKEARSVARQYLRAAESCVKNAQRGKLAALGNPPDEQSAQACLTNDVNGKVQRSVDKLTQTDDAHCLADPLQLPDYGSQDSGASLSSLRAQTLTLVADLFGPTLDPTVVSSVLDHPDTTKSVDRSGAKCQLAVLKRVSRLHDILWKEALSAKKKVLRGKARLAGVGPVLTPAELEAELSIHLVADSRGKIANAVAKLDATSSDRCDSTDITTPIPLLFLGQCELPSTPLELSTCLAARARCAFCLEINDFDNVRIDCDTLDNNLADGSCR